MGKKIIAYDDHLEIILDLDDTSIDDYHGTKVPFITGAADPNIIINGTILHLLWRYIHM